MSPGIQRRSLTVRYADYKALVNNSDFKCFLEVGSEPLSLCWAGNEFHAVGTATKKVQMVFLALLQQNFYRRDAISVAERAASKHLRVNAYVDTVI